MTVGSVVVVGFRAALVLPPVDRAFLGGLVFRCATQPVEQFSEAPHLVDGTRRRRRVGTR